jgi:two-component system, NtrC family, nitrogen regulation response regulator NtrX
VAESTDGASTIASAREGADLVLLDIRLGDDDGIELLRTLRKGHPQTPVIMVTGHGNVSLTAEAFKLGAHDFMEKPLRLLMIRTAVSNALESVRLRKRIAEQARKRCPQAVYCSEQMRALYAKVERLAPLSEPVVVYGPSGAGKELVAQALHYAGPRADAPFVATNTASMPSELAEDELFGHERGAFTGAHSRREGCIERAQRGTLFLDEIGDMDLKVQAKLLRVLETNTFTRLGGTENTTVDLRIVAATHRDLKNLAAEGGFRHDLWFRLCAFVLVVPSLEERRDDIPLLAATFLDSVNVDMHTTRRFSDAALALLRESRYPGNARQLKHVVTRAAVFADHDEIDETAVERAFGSALTSSAPADALANYLSLGFSDARASFERDYLTEALSRNGGNITATAAGIGMAQSNLSRKLRDLGIRGSQTRS